MDTTDHPRRWLYFLLVASGVFLSTMDSSMINVALPSIMRDFSLDLVDVDLVVLSYLMVVTFSLVFWGTVSDRFGKGRVFLAGMCIFTAGSTACAFAATFPLLIFFRCIQAFGAAMMMSTGPALIKLTFPPAQLGRSLGMVGIATSCGLMSGPVVGGYVLHMYSWHAIFLITVPLSSICVLLGAVFLLPNLSRLERRKRTPFDWHGTALWILLVVGYVIAFKLPAVLGWGGSLILIIALGGLGYRFWIIENRTVEPIMPIILVRQRYYWSAVIAAGISFCVLFIILILMPFYLDYVLDFSVDKIGYTMMAIPVTLVIVSPLSGRLYDHLGSSRLLSTLGLLVSLLALALIMTLDEKATLLQVFWRLALLGAGQSIFLSPNSASVLSRVEDRYAGITAGILATARNLGMLTGAALAGMLFALFFARVSGGGTLQEFQPDYIPAFLTAMHMTIGCATFLIIIGCVISVMRE